MNIKFYNNKKNIIKTNKSNLKTIFISKKKIKMILFISRYSSKKFYRIIIKVLLNIKK